MQTPVTYAALLLIVPNFLQIFKKCRNAGLSGIRSAWYQNKKIADTIYNPVPK
jgi:hypothetical protein